MTTMRAALQHGPGETPVVGEFPEPTPQDDEVLIDVRTVALGGHDVIGAYMDSMAYPCVVRGEGVGFDERGRRVYFGERSRLPYGGFAERTVVPAAEVWEVPDDISDRQAITMGIAGTGAYVPLQAARIQPGDTVLVTGSTGAVGQLGLQLARHLGAGRVVGAGRNRASLDALVQRGIADAVVVIGEDVEIAAEADALRAEAVEEEGYDVVLDIVFGRHFLSAAHATRPGGRIVTIGPQAGFTTPLTPPDTLYRWHVTWGTGQAPPAERHATWLELLDLARQGVDVNYREFPFEEAPSAYEAQRSMPRGKVVVVLS